VKCIFKYVYKGQHRATVEITEPAHVDDQPVEVTNGWLEVVHDEIKQYIISRYVSATESYRRIYGF
ncbi:hypothetical protein BGZ65_012386, partial [Modicella reniformis]